MTQVYTVFAPFFALVFNMLFTSPTVRLTANGPIQGVVKTSSLGQNYYAFKGIPFAEAPITGLDPYTGEEVDRRFKAPQPLKHNWTELYQADNFGDSCVVSTQIFPSIAIKSENCLFLNVYVPVGGAEKKTVLVWIHGGGFTEGNANDLVYGPDFLLSEDNIVVTIQYRLGIFGFLNLGFGEYTGNMGLKDQQLALKWVYQNIEQFSGNQNEILLFGESAGGASVTYHMLNEESRKYFNRALPMSGSVYSYFALSETGHLKRMQDCSNNTEINKIVKYMKTADTDDLAECHFAQDWGKTIKPEWAPTIENPGTVGAFLTKTPDEIYNSIKAPIMDTLFSFTSQEHICFRPDILNATEPLINGKDSELRLPFDDFNANTNPMEFEEALNKLENAYFANTSDVNSIVRENINLMSEINIRHSVLKNLLLQIKANKNGADGKTHKNTFFYRFGVNSGLNLIQFMNQLKYDGAAHADDICYIFHCHLLDPYNFYDAHLNQTDSKEFGAIKRMVKMITNFARTGNPTIEKDTPFRDCKSSNEVFCHEITIDETSTVTTDITEQLHYKTWREVEDIYKRIQFDNKLA